MEDILEYNTLELEKFGGKLEIKIKKIRNLQSDELLVKVFATTIHPADLAFLNGQYGNIKPRTPLTPGFEGSGLIVRVGENIDINLIGKKCAITANPNSINFNGLWSQYAYTNLSNIITFDKDLDYKKIALEFINPLTACGFIDTLFKKGVNICGQSGASSQFGKIFIKLCAKLGIKTVNLVRKKENIDQLIKLGANYVLSTSEPNWEKELSKILKDLNVNVFFDCVGGEVTGKIISALPFKSTIYHFGNLKLERLSELDTSDFIFQEKELKGWWLSSWVKDNENEVKKWTNYIIENSGNELFETKISNVFKLEDFEKGIEYYFMNMNKGKIILTPN